MAYYNKIGLLVLNNDSSAFLVCEPGSNYGFDTTDTAAQQMRKQFLMTGGQLEGESDIECLHREVQDELGCDVRDESIEFVAEYTDVAASHPDRDVSIKLYQGVLAGEPHPKAEIGALHWIGKADVGNELVSPIIRNKIIPDLVARGLLK
jgi:8-oxo-dGTP pyrophosphatase MutT (NUDIX family)